MKTIEDVKAATLVQLAAFYNAHNVDARISKFADRKSAERRVMAIIESLAIIAEQGDGDESPTAIVEPAAPVHKTRASRKAKPEVEADLPKLDKPEEEITEEEALAELQLLKAGKTEATKKTGAKSGLTLSAAIAQTWLDGDVAAKRMTRDGVTVLINGKVAEFKSTGAAFEALNLPMSKHIRFRMKLKAEGALVFEWVGQKYHFVLGRMADGNNT